MSEITAIDNKEMIILSGKDSITVKVPLDIAKMSVTIKNLMEDLFDEDNENIIPVPAVNGVILNKIFEFCNYIHTNQEEYDNVKAWIDDKSFTSSLSQWFIDYMNVDQQTMFEIILGANFLDIQMLLNMECKHVASIIRNKTPEELRTLFEMPKNEVVPVSNEAT